jgi:hypothetical protein
LVVGVLVIGHAPASSNILESSFPTRRIRRASADHDHSALVVRFDEDDHVRESVDKLAPDDTALNRGDRRSCELLLVRDVNEHAIHLGDELEAKAIAL